MLLTQRLVGRRPGDGHRRRRPRHSRRRPLVQFSRRGHFCEDSVFRLFLRRRRRHDPRRADRCRPAARRAASRRSAASASRAGTSPPTASSSAASRPPSSASTRPVPAGAGLGAAAAHRHYHLAGIKKRDRSVGAVGCGQGAGQGARSIGWPRPKPPSTTCRSKRCTSTRWARSTRSSTSSARCSRLEWFAADRIVVSPINVGQRHGRRPRTASIPCRRRRRCELLGDAPVYGGAIAKELLTPTGALLLSDYAHAFGPMPAMRVDRVGYGAGDRDLDGTPNVLRRRRRRSGERPRRRCASRSSNARSTT